MFGGDALLIEGIEAVDFVFFLADFERGAGVKTIQRHDGLLCDERCRAVRRAGVSEDLRPGDQSGTPELISLAVLGRKA